MKLCIGGNRIQNRAVVVAHSSEQSLPTPEDPGSNPTVSNFYTEQTVNCR